ncbi:hypothetical protein ACGFNU_20925 [Spirillospora sp. NPDC048911]|uniref:hypothetical protein n=1 Tax=Spirillospora sp. NPDC048911 TaxID=3364527 RepID=UPI0037207EB4
MTDMLFSPEHAFHGGLTAADIARLESEFAIAMVDLWCARSVLTNATDALQRAANLPATAPAMHALTVAENRAARGDQRAVRAAAAFRAAASGYEGARTALADIVQTAHERTPMEMTTQFRRDALLALAGGGGENVARRVAELSTVTDPVRRLQLFVRLSREAKTSFLMSEATMGRIDKLLDELTADPAKV